MMTGNQWARLVWAIALHVFSMRLCNAYRDRKWVSAAMISCAILFLIVCLVRGGTFRND